MEMLTMIVIAVSVMGLVADCVGVLVNLIRLQLDQIDKARRRKKLPTLV